MAGPHIKKHKLDTLEFELNEVLKKGSLTNKSQYCPKCKKHISLSVIDLHHKIHGEGGGFYSCGTCKTFFVTKNALNQHSKESCGASIIDVPTLEKRLQKMLKCSECGSLFHSLAELLEHNKADHKDLYSCFVCGVPFRSTLALRKHIDANHKDKMVSRKKTAASKSSNQYECQFCAIAVSTRVKLIAHILQKHPEIETELSAKAVGECNQSNVLSSVKKYLFTQKMILVFNGDHGKTSTLNCTILSLNYKLNYTIFCFQPKVFARLTALSADLKLMTESFTTDFTPVG